MMLMMKKILKLLKPCMKEFRNKRNILWDFDGVILDSMNIRSEGFRKVLRSYPESQVEDLVSYHRKNGGLSRYVKFRYFFKKIRGGEVEEEKVQELAREYSAIMRNSLTSAERLIPEVLNFIKAHSKDFRMHVVSGSDGEELRFLCKELNIDDYFLSIQGSPTPKIELVKGVLEENHYDKEQTCLIGDSVNDLEAAQKNDIEFFGYNNTDLKSETKNYIETFS